MSYVVPVPTAKTGHVAPFHHTNMPHTNSTEQRPILPVLLPEWGCVKCVQLTWPHEHTDWNYMLSEVTDCYIQLAYAIASRVRLLIVAPNTEDVERQTPPSRCRTNHLLQVPYERHLGTRPRRYNLRRARWCVATPGFPINRVGR